MKNRFHCLMSTELKPLIIGCALVVVFCTALTFVLLSVFPSISSAMAIMMIRTVGLAATSYLLALAVSLLLVNRCFMSEATGEGEAAPCTKMEGNDHV